MLFKSWEKIFVTFKIIEEILSQRPVSPDTLLLIVNHNGYHKFSMLNLII